MSRWTEVAIIVSVILGVTVLAAGFAHLARSRILSDEAVVPLFWLLVLLVFGLAYLVGGFMDAKCEQRTEKK